MSFIVPAVLPSSREDFEEKLGRLVHIPTVSRVQIDVVDGRFAKPASWPYSAHETSQGTPYPELEAMVQKGEMPPKLHQISYEIDLMCLDAERAADRWLALGASRLTFHIEGLIDPSRFFASIHKRYGSDVVAFGLAINITTDIEVIKSCLKSIAYVQFMGITNIGRQGQLFDEKVFDKIKRFRDWLPEVPVQVDGGVSLKNANKLVALGVSNIVVGSALSHSTNLAEEITKFEMLQTSYGV